MNHRIQTLPKTCFLAIVFLSISCLSAQDCDKKLNEWNKKSTFPSGLVDDYTDCVDKVEAGLTDLENKIRELQKLRNAQIATLETSLDKLSDHYMDEAEDDLADKYKARKRSLTKKHKKGKF